MLRMMGRRAGPRKKCQKVRMERKMRPGLLFSSSIGAFMKFSPPSFLPPSLAFFTLSSLFVERKSTVFESKWSPSMWFESRLDCIWKRESRIWFQKQEFGEKTDCLWKGSTKYGNNAVTATIKMTRASIVDLWIPGTVAPLLWPTLYPSSFEQIMISWTTKKKMQIRTDTARQRAYCLIGLASDFFCISVEAFVVSCVCT